MRRSRCPVVTIHVTPAAETRPARFQIFHSPHARLALLCLFRDRIHDKRSIGRPGVTAEALDIMKQPLLRPGGEVHEPEVRPACVPVDVRKPLTRRRPPDARDVLTTGISSN